MLPIGTIAQNLKMAMSNYGRSTGLGEVTELAGAVLVSSGVNYAVFNAAVIFEDLREQPGRISSLLDEAARFYQSRHLRWSCWVCDELLAPPDRSQLPRHMGALGLDWIAEHQGMFAEDLAPPARPLPYLEMRGVGDASSRLDFVQVSAQVFGLPGRIAQDIYGSEQFWNGGLTAWVGYAGNRPVTTAATATAAGVVGVYSVATVFDHQRRGFAETITRHALEEASKAAGTRRTILQSSAAGRRLYRKMGYRPQGRFLVYASR